MSQRPGSRAERRRNVRSDAPQPARRDPMGPIYIGLVVVVVAILAAFVIVRFVTKRQQQAQALAAYATPTPGPAAKRKGIQLRDLQPVGKPYFSANPSRLPDTANGGNGAPVNGISCESTEGVALHIHTHLSLIANGTLIQVPAYIGMAASGGTGCLYWLHTHGPDGIIHVEAPQLRSPNGGPFTLGQFFDIWGQPLSNAQVATLKGPVVAYVDGAPYMGNLRDVPLMSHEDVTLEVGPHMVPPPHYLLPPND